LVAGQLLAVARLLMSLEADQQQQELLRNTVVAASKGAKHTFLLDLIQKDAQAGVARGAPCVFLTRV